MPRFGGIATMMRLPHLPSAEGLDVAFVGVPLDIGTSNRPGARFGPRAIRAESPLLRPCNLGTGDSPFKRLRVADLGDVAVNPYNLQDSVMRIERYYEALLAHGCIPVTLGGDHTIALPILRAMARRHGPVALVHVDAHADVNDEMFGEKIAHGTPFRRAVEEGLLTCDKVFQIGLRGTGYTPDEFDWGASMGFHVIPAAQCWSRPMDDVVARIRAQVGDHPLYISFDIDGLDPAYAPGTGTPEIAGLSSVQALQLIRGCAGMNIVGADVVEVSPPFDCGGMTALTAANLAFELLCAVPSRPEGEREA
ncbi:agmatinase [Bordetella petrii]|uniref:agmatinase n=1 Tax=Bordetella petrii TaxID=94624 RepID=UPI0004AF33E4|nr:agmatinase [Bordetella petrii]